MKLRFALLLFFLLLALAAPALAAEPVRFTVTVRYASVRAGPGLNYKTIQTAVHNQVFGVVGRTADNVWLQIGLPQATSAAWVRAGSGRVSGNLNSLPVKKLTLTAPTVS